MASIFQDLLSKMSSSQAFTKSSDNATEWLKNNVVKQSATINTKNIIGQMRERHVTKVSAGKMYLFGYDAKTKDTLPYYDMYPLIFPFKKAQDGFYGINMHYLPYRQRALLMDALYPFISDDNNDEMSRLRISYSILKKFSRSNLIKPCIKRYLNKHIKTKISLVLPNEWNHALFLPLHRFEGASTKQVYKDSLQK